MDRFFVIDEIHPIEYPPPATRPSKLEERSGKGESEGV